MLWAEGGRCGGGGWVLESGWGTFLERAEELKGCRHGENLEQQQLVWRVLWLVPCCVFQSFTCGSELEFFHICCVFLAFISDFQQLQYL